MMFLTYKHIYITVKALPFEATTNIKTGFSQLKCMLFQATFFFFLPTIQKMF